jgi:murein DD-endopeptidase MepM/ murein hydrolase activator NlpD
MSNNFFTLMIIPRRKSAVTKLSLSSTLIRGLLIVFIMAILLTLYMVYDYASIKRDKAELARLRIETVEQSQQLQELALKIDEFADRIEEFNQFDKKLRIVANYQIARDKRMLLGIGGSGNAQIKVKDLLDQDQVKLVSGMRKSISQLNEDANVMEKSFSELLKFLREQKSLLAATPSIWPVKGWVTSGFGSRKSPFSSGGEFHGGFDIATRIGKEVICPADGYVVEVGHQAADGNRVKIDHGHGIMTSFSHLSKFATKQGSRVKRGDVLGYVGTTGRSTGPHLHYVVYLNKIPVNPRRYLN